MKRFMIVLLMFASIVEADKKEVVIGPYGIGEFAIKGSIKAKIEELITEIKADKDSINVLQITVIGSADITGVSSQNDVLSKERADAVRGALDSEFPAAKINIIPAGDGENKKQVRVIYEFIPVQEDNFQKTVLTKIDSVGSGIHARLDNQGVQSNNRIILIAITILVVAVLVLFLRRGKKEKKEEIWFTVNNTFEVLVTKIITITPDGKKKFELISPFKKEGEKNITTDHPRKMTYSLRGCLKEGSPFFEQIPGLREGGFIRELSHN